MASQMDPSGKGVPVGPLTVRSPGLRGVATVLAPSAGGSRAPAMGTKELRAALDDTDVTEDLTLELSSLRATARVSGRARSADAIEVDVPAPGVTRQQMLLLAEEDGGLSWHFPEADATTSTSRGRRMLTYRIPAFPLPPAPSGASRGVISAAGSKVLKILTFPITPLLAKAGQAITHNWEAKHRPARWRTFTPDDYGSAEVPDLDEAGWQRLTGGPALLFVHGTASSSHLAFRRLPEGTMRTLFDRYGGRVFALDHHSFWLTPAANVAAALKGIPAGLELDLDIVSHSRGGLVARELMERREVNRTPSTLRVRTFVMVAVPNEGTDIARKENHRKWLDLFTNMLQMLPDNTVVDMLVIAIELAKDMAMGIFDGLEGLTAMDPDSATIHELNGALEPKVFYRAISAEYEPAKGSALSRKLRDLAFDQLFSGKPNDLVVPTVPALEIPRRARIEPPYALEFGKHDDVEHGTFFGRPEVAEKLLEWLPG